MIKVTVKTTYLFKTEEQFAEYVKSIKIKTTGINFDRLLTVDAGTELVLGPTFGPDGQRAVTVYRVDRLS